MARRTSSSVRFDDYWKVQWWEARSLAWRDVQKAWPSLEEAVAAFDPALRCRVMHVFEGGRQPLNERGEPYDENLDGPQGGWFSARD